MKFVRALSAIIIVSLLLLTATACGKKQEPAAAPADNTVLVNAGTAHKGDINAIAAVTGKIAAQNEVNIMPKMGGKVAEVPVDVGSIVEAGQVVLKLDAAELKAQVSQAQAGYSAAKANYLKLKVGARPEQLSQSKASLSQAEANYKKALSDLNRNKELFNEGAISEQTLEAAKVQFTTAEASYNSAKASLAMLEKGETAESFQVLQAQMEQAEAVLELQQANYANAVIKSPIDGIVGVRNVDAGEIASSGVASLTIINIDSVKVETNVTENQVNKLTVGQEVNVKVNAASGKNITGKISTIAPMANPQNKLYAIKITIQNKDHALKPGMFAEISLPVEKKQNVLLIPREAITEINGQKVVYIINSESKVESKKVDVGLSDGKVTEVLGGLDEGVSVVTTNQQSLDNGTKVRVQQKI